MEVKETKVCSKCGRELPLKQFRLMDNKINSPYHLRQCKECEYQYQREYIKKKNQITFSENIEMLVQRQYKEIKPERILDTSRLPFILLGTDEIFVKLMDYKDTWLSNYGRIIRYSNGKYNLLQGSYDRYGNLAYNLSKCIFYDGKWVFRRSTLYAAKAVIEEFIVNPDVRNVHIWHSGYDKQDCYYRNLYPLNQEQYRIVKRHYRETGDDSEKFILNVMNDIKFKADDWSKRSMKPSMCGIGYWGTEELNSFSDAYTRWHDMINRCYNEKFHQRQPQYKDCTVCEEWKSLHNFKVWYEKNKYGEKTLDLDKDILFKGNTVYSPETCCLVPHEINTLFLNRKSGRGDFPLGVHYEKERGKYQVCMAFMGKQIKLGRFDTAEKAFTRYKEYKERFIKDMAEKYREKIPYKVCEAMRNWKIEITD